MKTLTMANDGKVNLTFSSGLSRGIGSLNSPSKRRPVGLLPPVVRWIAPSRKAIILERPPEIMTAHFFNSDKYTARQRKDEARTLFNIPLPWQLYYISVHAGRRATSVSAMMFVRRTPLQTLDDLREDLQMYPLPNVMRDNGTLCLADEARVYRGDGEPPLADLAILAVSGFWNSGFNLNMTGWEYGALPEWKRALDKQRLSALEILNHLDQSTLEDALSWSYPSTGMNLKNYIDVEGQQIFDHLFNHAWGAD